MDDSFPTERYTTEAAATTATHVEGLACFDPHDCSPAQEYWSSVGAPPGLPAHALTGYREATPFLDDTLPAGDDPAAFSLRVPMGAGTACLACVSDSVSLHTCGGSDDWTISLLTY